MSEQGGRYQRSFEGLIGAIIVTVLGVVAFVVFRGFFSDPPEQDVPDVDLAAEVLNLQQNGADLVYPATLPEGWKATRVEPTPATRDQGPRYDINLFTRDDEFVGIRQADQDAAAMLADAGVDDVRTADPLTGVGDLAPTWDGWSDPDGDHAFTASLGEETVLVYGAVDPDELADVVARLTTAPLPTASPS
ncbi:DUF4245 family protein [Nocardioides sp. C4-1]|uniref:DUF4245 family protein n=1 Tax=Nocardioides sp. C4-1 TaxID=3151851 RepID=UPI003263B974